MSLDNTVPVATDTYIPMSVASIPIPASGLYPQLPQGLTPASSVTPSPLPTPRRGPFPPPGPAPGFENHTASHAYTASTSSSPASGMYPVVAPMQPFANQSSSASENMSSLNSAPSMDPSKTSGSAYPPLPSSMSSGIQVGVYGQGLNQSPPNTSAFTPAHTHSHASASAPSGPEQPLLSPQEVKLFLSQPPFPVNLRKIAVPSDLFAQFHKVSESNTLKNVETCGTYSRICISKPFIHSYSYQVKHDFCDTFLS